VKRLAVLALFAACGGDDTSTPPDASVVGIPGTYTIAGVVRFEKKPPLESGALGPITPTVSRGASVAVIAETGGATLAMGVTGDDGTYSLQYDAVGGDPIHILVVTSSTLPARPVSVVHPTGGGTAGMIHGFGGPKLSAGVDTHSDVLVTVASNTAGAFNIFDQLISVADRIHTTFDHPTPDQLTAIWEIGNQDGTYYDGKVHLLGASDDDDGFDDTVILHECGHYIEDHEGRSDSPGGSHNGDPTDPRLAWSEGFATYWAMAVRGAPVYMDSNAGGGFAEFADTEVTKAQINQPLGQLVSENMVTEILWDHGDGGATDDDPLTTSSHDAVLAVQKLYLKTATLRAVGSGGVDLVDWLDGWFVTNGLGTCAASKTIVSTTHTFPYDFAGPGGTCP